MPAASTFDGRAESIRATSRYIHHQLGSGRSIYRPATAFGAPNTAVFSLDFSGQFQFVTGQSQVFLFGLRTDRFVTGRWAFTTSTAPAQIPGGAANPLADPTALDAFFAAG